MTQLDLPQISFARYLELLKRRRWQVIPVSLLGLFVGGITAFLIPRYYVAKTTVAYQGHALDPAARTTADPFQALVGNAPLSIPATVPDALEKLPWLEARDEDEDRRVQFIDDVKGRVAVRDVSPGSVDQRPFVNLEISYRDTDGQRAAEFVTELRNTWIEKQHGLFKAEAERAISYVQEEVRDAARTLDNARRDKRNHEQQFELDPQDREQGQAAELSSLSVELRDLDRRKAERTGEAARRREEIASYLKALEDGSVQKKILDKLPVDVDPIEKQKLDEAMKTWLKYSQAVAHTKPAHREYYLFKAALAQAEAELAKFEESGLGKAVLEVEKENPEFTKLGTDMRGAQSALDGLEAQLEQIDGRIALLDERKSELPEVWEQYLELLERYDTAKQDLDQKREKRDEYRDRYELALTGDPFAVIAHANVPPRPTEPNITLVALAGCAIGLGVAIGLVLLFDFLRSTFKTIEDVEQALPVPVLGSMAHLETAEERTRVVSHRRRVSLVAGAFLVLVLSLVLIYYVAPTRLPPSVLQALDFLLGPPR